MKLADTIIRRRINKICLQETRWVGEKSREIENTRYNPRHTQENRVKTGGRTCR